jgi:hypothetical protein
MTAVALIVFAQLIFLGTVSRPRPLCPLYDITAGMTNQLEYWGWP